MHLTIRRTPRVFRVLDVLMIPIMFILGGFKLDSIQETHPWHMRRRVDLTGVDHTKVVPYAGKERTYKERYTFLFHAPIFGGWKEYGVYRPVDHHDIFFIGWSTNDRANELQQLPLRGAVRTLTGPDGASGFFYAVDRHGHQLKLERIDTGTLGDNRYPHVRLL